MSRREYCFPLTLCSLALLTSAACDLSFPGGDPVSLLPASAFVLCEGNFGGNNASLWQISLSPDTSYANVFQAVSGELLGDTGQSLHISGESLYIVVNRSHSIEILDLSGDRLAYVGRIELPGASPREMATVGNAGYISCWGIPGILQLDLAATAVTDTFQLDGLPEDILADDNYLYVALALHTDYSAHDRVIKIALSSGRIEGSYAVGLGPQRLLVKGDELYISRQWYDSAYNSFRGLTVLNLTSAEAVVTDWGPGSGADIFSIGDQVYVATGAGVVPVAADGSLMTAEAIGAELASQYAAAADGRNIFIATADFVTPGQVYLFNTKKEQKAIFTVGMGPGDFAFF